MEAGMSLTTLPALKLPFGAVTLWCEDLLNKTKLCPINLGKCIGELLRRFIFGEMPFLHRDNGRDGGGSKENRNPWGNSYNLDFPLSAGPAAAPINEQQSNEACSSNAAGQRDWSWNDWEAPASPEAARSPMSSVPAACFPPQHPTAFASYSESACSGSWANEMPSEIADLTASLNALTVAPPSAGGSLACSPQYVQERHPYESIDKNVEPPWPPEHAQSVPLNYLPNVGMISRGKDDVLRWSGALPPRGMDSRNGYSTKVFLGGLPWDITEEALVKVLKNFRPVRVEWPGREGQTNSAGAAGTGAEYTPRGYAYITFDNEWRVRALLSAANCDGTNWFYRISSRSMRSKEVQVIPWAVSDSNWVCGGSARLEPSRTVFVGALHGMLSAYALALIMNDLFSGVIYAGIDTDKNKYPIGSGRVTFNNVHSYVRAVSAAYVEIATDKFTKTVQVDPYLEDSMCSSCNLQQGPYFCRDPLCFRYFCRSCWARQHQGINHKQLMRNSKGAYTCAPGTFPVATASTLAFAAGPAPPHRYRPPKQTSESTKFPALEPAPAVDSKDYGSALPPCTVPVPQQPAPCAQSHVVSKKSYHHNGYKKSKDGTPSLSPTGSSELEGANATEDISQRSM